MTKGRLAWGSLTELQLQIHQVPLSRPLSRTMGHGAGPPEAGKHRMGPPCCRLLGLVRLRRAVQWMPARDRCRSMEFRKNSWTL